MKNSNLILGGLVLVGVLGGLIAYGVSNKNTADSTKTKVVAGFYPMGYFASQIGGDMAEVRTITPAGAEPHDYEPTSKDLAAIETADLIVLNGGIEPWGEKVKVSLKEKSTIIVTAGDNLFTKEFTEDGQIEQDPHVWLDPQLAKQQVQKITQGFKKADPANASLYEANEKNLLNRLDGLDSSFRQGLTACTRRDIVTSHAAFAYLADRYGLKQVAISGLSPEEEPSAKDLAEVSKFVKDNDVKYIFFETLVSPKLSQTIATETGAQTLELNTLEGLTDDEIKDGSDYFTVMQSNLSNLQTALGCTQ